MGPTALSRRSFALVAPIVVLGGCSAAEPPPLPPLGDPAWEVQYQDSAALFIGLSAVDESVVWASGSGGRVARTTDGGATWEVVRVPGEEDAQFRDVHAFSADEAYVMSIPTPVSRIHHTTDGGRTWALVYEAPDEGVFLDCFSFWAPGDGFAFADAVEGEFVLLRTRDGGPWDRIDPAAVPDARPDGEGAFAASGTCVITRPGGLGWFATGASGVDTRVIRTLDHGDTWSAVTTPIPSVDPTSGIFSLAFLDDLEGVAFGGNLSEPDSTHADVAVTDDGGLTWTLVGTTGLRGAVYGGAWVPDAPTPTLVSVSPDGSAFSADGGRTWTRIDDADAWTVAVVSPDAGWSAGRGTIRRLRWGG